MRFCRQRNLMKKSFPNAIVNCLKFKIYEKAMEEKRSSKKLKKLFQKDKKVKSIKFF